MLVRQRVSLIKKQKMNTNDNVFVLSLGGSLVVPNGGIDTKFLIDFNKFIRQQISSKKRRFFITVGGGATTRHYQEAASKVKGEEIIDEDLDWLGIHATRLNAHMLRIIFRDIAEPRVIKHYEIILKVNAPVVMAAGWQPGWSTDYCAVMLCKDYGIDSIINLSNINYVYDKDPGKYKDAKPIKATSWQEFRKLTGDKWTPGMHIPFDPVASKLAQEIDLTVIILNGKNLKNLAKALDGEPFIGTKIGP